MQVVQGFFEKVANFCQCATRNSLPPRLPGNGPCLYQVPLQGIVHQEPKPKCTKLQSITSLQKTGKCRYRVTLG